MTLLTTISKIGLYLEIILHPILKVRCIFENVSVWKWKWKRLLKNKRVYRLEAPHPVWI